MNASPWLKYLCASGLHVATDRVCSPRPVKWKTLDLDAPSGLVGSPSTELGPTATAAESAINISMFLDRMMRPPLIFWYKFSKLCPEFTRGASGTLPVRRVPHPAIHRQPRSHSRRS